MVHATLGVQSGLIGRVTELADVVRLLEPGRVLTLTGIGGSGKTRIARRVSADADRYVDGVWVVELADLTDADLVADVVAEALDLRIPAGAPHRSILASFFVEHPGLLVLDNCEHLVAPVADLVADLLALVPALTVLATSRLPLGIMRETVFQVPPLSTPRAGARIDLAGSLEYDSIALYVRRATEAMASYRLTEDNVGDVAALATRLDGIPLAIELAAARVRLLSAESLLARISDHLTLLESDLRDRPVRQRSLTASLDWSYDVCSAAERELWNRLSVFVGGFDLAAAESVCSGGGIAVEDVLGLLSALVDMSVVGRVGQSGTRLRMLEPIRQFGAERLAEGGRASLWRDRHLHWYADLSPRMEREWAGPDQVAWMDTMRAEHPNLRAALEHALARPGTAAIALRMCHDLQHLWICGGHFGEARRWIERSVAATEGARLEKIRALRLSAWFGALQTDLGYARDRVREATALHESAEDEDGDDLADLELGYLLFADGVVTSWETDLERGVVMLAESNAAFCRSGDLTGIIQSQLKMGIAYVFAGDFENAGRVHRSCVQATDALGEICVGAYARWSLGLVALMTGNLVEAEALERDALARSADLGDNLAMAFELETMAWIAALDGDGERATLLLGGAGSIWRRINMPVERTPYVCDLHAMGEAQSRALLDEESFARFLDRGLHMPLLDVVDLALGAKEASVGRSEAGPLSRRENEVAALVAEGLTNRDIAERLFVSERTVGGHVQSILRKLGFSSRARVAAWVTARRHAADLQPRQ
ncbi:MAG TPA: LuxR C-terminal-related transcriptional regulator [Marmoricola sp.]|nr:LuxR C-terminal-related transcriptional regulator [Marmoricola sp.]